jgi:hypothetical protein
VGTASLMLAATAVFLPGLLASSALYRPGRLSVPGRVALSVALGYTISSILAFGLAVANMLQPVLFVVLLTAVSFAAGIVAVKGRGFRAQLSAIGEEVREEPWPLIAGLLVIVLIAALKLPLSGLQNLGSATPFRYWADALEMADSGQIPEQSLQWGRVYAPTISKVLLNSFGAGMSFVMQDAPLPAMRALTCLAAVGVSASIWWFAHELGLRLTGPLLPLLTLMNTIFRSELTNDLNFFRAESFGRMMAFSALALALRAARARDGRQDVVLAGVLFGVSTGSHLVPTAVAVGILFWYGVSLIPRAGGVDGFVKRVVPIICLAGVIGLVVPWLARGDLAFQAAAGSNQYRAVGGYDPTALFTSGEQRRFAPGSRALYEPVDDLLKEHVESAIGLSPENPYPLLLGGILAAILLAVAVPPLLKPVPLVALGLAANLIIASIAFSYLYDAFVPASFGARRLADYAVLPVILLILTAIEGALMQGGKVDVRVPLAAATGITVAVALLLLAVMLPLPGPRPWQLRNIQYLNEIRNSLPCDARILSNRRTGGTIQVLTGRTGILEGMGPHLRPQFLRETVKLLLDANQFYQRPVSNIDFLERREADYVLLVHRSFDPALRTVEADFRIFDNLRFLELVAKTPGADLYRVVGIDKDADVPRPDEFPGFRCGRAPIVY